jgi:hypothetical protein
MCCPTCPKHDRWRGCDFAILKNGNNVGGFQARDRATIVEKKCGRYTINERPVLGHRILNDGVRYVSGSSHDQPDWFKNACPPRPRSERKLEEITRY